MIAVAKSALYATTDRTADCSLFCLLLLPVIDTPLLLVSCYLSRASASTATTVLPHRAGLLPFLSMSLWELSFQICCFIFAQLGVQQNVS